MNRPHAAADPATAADGVADQQYPELRPFGDSLTLPPGTVMAWRDLPPAREPGTLDIRLDRADPLSHAEFLAMYRQEVILDEPTRCFRLVDAPDPDEPADAR